MSTGRLPPYALDILHETEQVIIEQVLPQRGAVAEAAFGDWTERVATGAFLVLAGNCHDLLWAYAECSWAMDQYDRPVSETGFTGEHLLAVLERHGWPGRQHTPELPLVGHSHWVRALHELAVSQYRLETIKASRPDHQPDQARVPGVWLHPDGITCQFCVEYIDHEHGHQLVDSRYGYAELAQAKREFLARSQHHTDPRLIMREDLISGDVCRTLLGAAGRLLVE